MLASATLRVRPSTRDRINRLAKEDRVPAPEFLERLVQKEEEDRLLASMNAGFESVRLDADASRSFDSETAEWDSTSGDLGAEA